LQSGRHRWPKGTPVRVLRPLFCTVGQLAPAPVVVGGAIEVRASLLLRYSYDERIEDGVYAASAIAMVRGWIEDPAAWIGD
jgi:pyruvate/2-oxoglutarate dehydrogenase complex dihydrolipoamide acyltransferase (E2) component